MTQGIKDKVIVITGARSGLGEATARHLAKHGAKLVLGARRVERLEALAGELALGNQAVVRRTSPIKPRSGGWWIVPWRRTGGST